jgi:hypothetical protein
MSKVDEEIDILFGSICDGLRQEVRYRYLNQLLAPKDDMRLTEERERALVSALAFYIRASGFMVHVEHYWYGDDDGVSSAKTPDLAVRLPKIGKYLFLEAKRIYLGNNAVDRVSEDLDKLTKPTNPLNKRNGFLAIGFAWDEIEHKRFQNQYRSFSNITNKYHFREFRIESVDLKNVGDPELKYAIVGIWLRKLRR